MHTTQSPVPEDSMVGADVASRADAASRMIKEKSSQFENALDGFRRERLLDGGLFDVHLYKKMMFDHYLPDTRVGDGVGDFFDARDDGDSVWFEYSLAGSFEKAETLYGDHGGDHGGGGRPFSKDRTTQSVVLAAIHGEAALHRLRGGSTDTFLKGALPPRTLCTNYYLYPDLYPVYIVAV